MHKVLEKLSPFRDNDSIKNNPRNLGVVLLDTPNALGMVLGRETKGVSELVTIVIQTIAFSMKHALQKTN